MAALLIGLASVAAQQGAVTGEPLVVRTTSLPRGYLHQPYQAKLEAQGGMLPLHWELTEGTLPSGIVLHADGTLGGSPEINGEFHFTVNVTDSGKPAMQGKQPLVLAVVSPLDQVIRSMDHAAASFRSTEASFVWDQYQKVVDETDTQKGKVYFRRTGNEVEMAADITEPAPEQILFREGKVQLYQPRIDQITVYNAGKDRAAFESFLVLGFGGSGQDMLKSFDVSYIGTEKVGDVEAAKLQLVPKSQKVKNNFDHILLWIDPARGISIQQQFFTPSGDYRLAKYSEMKLNEKISDAAFRLRTTAKTKTVSPQG